MTSPQPPYYPSEWDVHFSQSNAPIQLAELLKDAPPAVRARRELHLAMTSRQPERTAEALAELDRHSDEAVAGMRLLAYVNLGEYGHVLATSEQPLTSLDPYAVEDACDAAFARGMALAEMRHFGPARGQLLIARRLAEALGMRYRAQHIEMETGRVCTLMGDPDPQRIIDAMAREPLSDRRRRWGVRILAEAYLALGDYRAAAVQLASNQPCDLAAFTSGLLGEAVPQTVPDAGGPYAGVAAALWALRLGEPITTPKASGSSPQAEYAVILRAWAMLRARSMAGQARHMLLGLQVLSPDQQAHRSAALIQAAAMLHTGDDIEALTQTLNTALGRMTSRVPFLTLLRVVHPEAYVLLGLLPDIHPEVAETLPELPILTGSAIAYRYQSQKLPGKSNGSAVLVLSAAIGRTGPESRPHPQAAQRLRDALAELGASSYVNLGTMLRALIFFRTTVRQSETSKWTEAIERALDWVDSAALQSDLRRELDL